MRRIVWAGLAVVVAITALTAQGAETYAGTVSDSMCKVNHAAMKASSDPTCVVQCVKHGSKYVLVVGEKIYGLSDQQTPERFAARKVRVTGSVDAKTNMITVASMQAAD